MRDKSILFKNKPTFKDFERKNRHIKKTEEEKELSLEMSFLKELHKLDGKNFEFIKDEEIDSFIEEYLLQE